MAFKIKATVEIDDTMRRLSTLQKSVQKRVAKKAASKAAQAMARHAKSLVPKRVTFKRVRVEVGGKKKVVRSYAKRFQLAVTTSGVTTNLSYSGGQLKNSIGWKVNFYRKSKVAVAIVGPRDGFREQIGVVTRGKNKGKPVFVNPSKYAHLVELGTRGSKAKPFLQPAAEIGARMSAATLRAEVARAIDEASA